MLLRNARITDKKEHGMQRIFNTITGTAVIAVTVGMAVFMIARANICLKRLANEQL